MTSWPSGGQLRGREGWPSDHLIANALVELLSSDDQNGCSGHLIADQMAIGHLIGHLMKPAPQAACGTL